MQYFPKNQHFYKEWLPDANWLIFQLPFLSQTLPGISSPFKLHLKCIFIIQARGWLLLSGWEGDWSLLGCRFPLATFRCRKRNFERLCLTEKAEGMRPGHFIAGFSPGLTPCIRPQLPRSRGMAEAACSVAGLAARFPFSCFLTQPSHPGRVSPSFSSPISDLWQVVFFCQNDTSGHLVIIWQP